MTAHCPHCGGILQDGVSLPFPMRGTSCPHCRLIVGVGRARDPGAVSSNGVGSSAGFAANAARRQHAEPMDPGEALRALRDVATTEHVAIARLRMMDYVVAASHRPELPSLARIVATFDSWQTARILADATDLT